MAIQTTLKSRLAAKYCVAEQHNPVPHLPVDTVIDGELEQQLNQLAHKARFGASAIRDHLYIAFLPRLERLAHILKPFPNTSTHTGVWDRDDVSQESWLVFHELLMSWDEHLGFATYLLANFQFRLKDRIMRGIGRRQSGLIYAAGTEDEWQSRLFASDDDQPEQAIIAKQALASLVATNHDGPIDSDRARDRALRSQHSGASWVEAWDIGRGRTA